MGHLLGVGGDGVRWGAAQRRGEGGGGDAGRGAGVCAEVRRRAAGQGSRVAGVPAMAAGGRRNSEGRHHRQHVRHQPCGVHAPLQGLGGAEAQGEAARLGVQLGAEQLGRLRGAVAAGARGPLRETEVSRAAARHGLGLWPGAHRIRDVQPRVASAASAQMRGLHHERSPSHCSLMWVSFVFCYLSNVHLLTTSIASYPQLYVS